MKICGRCKNEKNVDEFNNNKTEKDGKCKYCRECDLIRGKEYRNKNRDKINQKSREYRNKNPDKNKEAIAKYLKKNPHMSSKTRMRQYRQNDECRKKMNNQARERYKNKDKNKLREYNKKYYQKNKESQRRKANEWKKNKKKIDGFYRMKINLSARIRDFLKNGKSKNTMEIVGLNKHDFRKYIENLFSEGMSWDNYGKWHLDHKKPIYLAKNEEDLYKLNHYTNLQPLWAEDNIKKNRRYDE